MKAAVVGRWRVRPYSLPVLGAELSQGPTHYDDGYQGEHKDGAIVDGSGYPKADWCPRIGVEAGVDVVERCDEGKASELTVEASHRLTRPR